MCRVAHIAAAAACFWAALALPAFAVAADPGRSHVEAQAPSLAPGIWGTAPLYGTMDPSGAFSLSAPAGAISTGNPVYDGLLRATFRGGISMRSAAPALVRSGAKARRLRTQAVVQAGIAGGTVPVIVRTLDGPDGRTLRTFFSVPLAPYGVVNPAGGSPGSVRIAITAFFPNPR